MKTAGRKKPDSFKRTVLTEIDNSQQNKYTAEDSEIKHEGRRYRRKAAKLNFCPAQY